MAGAYQIIVEIFFFLIIALAGFAIGKSAYGLILVFANRLVKKTKSSLDDYVLKAAEGPLEAIIIVLTLYVLSDFVAELSRMRDLSLHYSLAILVILIAYSLSEIFGALLRWYYDEGRAIGHLKMDVTLLPFIRKASKIIILFLGMTLSLSILGIDVTAILTLTSIIALVLGLASQESLANIFAGLALQLDRPYLYGEYLRFPTGEVAKLIRIGLRSTRFEDLGGNIMFISNSEFAKLRLTNLSKPAQEFKATISAEIPLKVGVGRIESIIRKEIAAGKVPGLSRREFSVAVEKVNKDQYVAGIDIWVSDFNGFGKARNYINRSLLKMVG